MSKQKSSKVAGVLVIVSGGLLVLPFCVPYLIEVFPATPYTGDYCGRILVSGLLPMYLSWVARVNAKANEQRQLAAASLILMGVSVCATLFWIMISFALSTIH